MSVSTEARGTPDARDALALLSHDHTGGHAAAADLRNEYTGLHFDGTIYLAR